MQAGKWAYDFGDMNQRHLIPNTKQWVGGGVVWKEKSALAINK